ncbi:hypothetical protein [Streptomyces fulvorobeus]|uniref:Uncharacterized protein n=1 Tax=Streptomyces fulvorobeus TaxID=284028 RepID=A0A7J0BZ59_9ACTN|nr:hypothetical protein [Streptomyces fulvorobeus]NYE39330.1 hypothetical protein [Streptomyces fulvorobeus]GFM95549.1 hypothetical protein Sfulv_03600 [Streptomyces fulvorobeus]
MNDFPLVDRLPAPERYGSLRVRTSDLGPARWLTERAPGQGLFGTAAGVAAPGFDAYARVLHPASLDERPVRWAEVAAAYGREVGPGTRWHEVVGTDQDHPDASDSGLPGVWDEYPGEGPTPPAVAEALIPVLARHTATPGHCWFGLWHGYGRWDFDHVPTFGTPHREEVLLTGALHEAVSPVSLDEFAELPDLWWPQDRAWCLGGDVDLMSTYIGGSRELIADLLAAPGLEARPVAPDDRVG